MNLSGQVAPEEDLAPSKAPDLFGRGMLYVLVWSMQLIVGTLASPILTHIIPRNEFGSLAAAIALYQLLILVSVFGIDQALEMQRIEDSDGLRSRGLLAVGVLFAFVVTGIAAMTSPLWASAIGFGGPGGLPTVTLLWTAPGAACLMVLALLQAEDRLLKFCTVSLLATVGGQVFGLILLFTLERSAVTYAWGGVLGNFAGLILGLAWTRPRVGGLRDSETIRRALHLGVPLLLAGIADFVLNTADRFIIQASFGPGQVARYQVAFTVGNAITLILIFTNRAWIPRLKSVVDVDERWRLIASSRDGIYWLLGWSLLAITVASPALLRIVAPANYDQQSLSIVVFIIGLAALPVAATGATSRMLITIRLSHPIAWSSAAALIVKLVVTFALLKSLGLTGAALGTLAGLSIQAVWLRFATAKRHPPIRSGRPVIVFLCVVMLTCAVATVLPQTLAWNVGRMCFAALCAAPLVHALRALQAGRQPIGARASD